jgi:hypothetical protein
MKTQMSKDFKKRFWRKFDNEFGPEPTLWKNLLIPTAIASLLITLFITNQTRTTKFDPVAVEIALEVDESLAGIWDTTNLYDSETWYEQDTL